MISTGFRREIQVGKGSVISLIADGELLIGIGDNKKSLGRMVGTQYALRWAGVARASPTLMVQND